MLPGVQLDTESLERLVPDQLEDTDVTGQATLSLHIERYEFAAAHVHSGRVLDMACGVGFGSRILRNAGGPGASVLGVDIDPAAVAYARQHYGGEGIEFRASDAMQFEDLEGFDLIVSLETVEHVPDPTGLLARLMSLLRPGGILVASVPTTPSVDLNPHHLHDFTAASFRASLRARGAIELDQLTQIQPVDVWALLRRRERRMGDLRQNLPLYYLTHPGSLLRRVGATLTHGFANHYLTIASQGPSRA